MTTPPITALHIGVNEVNPGSFESPPRRLQGAEADARALSERTVAAGLSPRVLVGGDAKRANVIAALDEAAAALAPGALFVLSFSGHGAQDDDAFGPRRDDELDGLDEVWCLADDFLLDDELYAQLARFRAGVRVLVIADCCHAGSGLELTTATELPPGWEPRRYARADARRSLEARAPELRARVQALGQRGAVGASVILLGACPSGGFAYEADGHGVFTAAFCALWDRGAPLSHRAFIDALQPACAPQGPVYEFIAPEARGFAGQRPLTAAAPPRR